MQCTRSTLDPERQESIWVMENDVIIDYRTRNGSVERQNISCFLKDGHSSNRQKTRAWETESIIGKPSGIKEGDQGKKCEQTPETVQSTLWLESRYGGKAVESMAAMPQWSKNNSCWETETAAGSWDAFQQHKGSNTM